MITIGPGVVVLHKDHAILAPSKQTKPSPQQELVYTKVMPRELNSLHLVGHITSTI
jgi:hypothetical protein